MASRSKLDYRQNLIMRQMEPLHDFGDRCSHFQIVEADGNRCACPGIPRHPLRLPGRSPSRGTVTS